MEWSLTTQRTSMWCISTTTRYLFCPLCTHCSDPLKEFKIKKKKLTIKKYTDFTVLSSGWTGHVVFNLVLFWKELINPLS